jgi:hypothetical protein
VCKATKLHVIWSFHIHHFKNISDVTDLSMVQAHCIASFTVLYGEPFFKRKTGLCISICFPISHFIVDRQKNKLPPHANTNSNIHPKIPSSEQNLLFRKWIVWPPLWSSGQSFWLQIQRSRVRFPTLQDFLRSRGSGTGSTQSREDKWGATWMKK